MGDVVSLNERIQQAAARPAVSNENLAPKEVLEQFPLVIEGPETRRCVARWIGRYARLGNVALDKPAPVRYVHNTAPAGIVQAVPGRRGKIGVVTSGRFPAWLAENTELDTAKAIGLAGHYVAAYSAIADRLRGVRVKENNNLIEQYWQGDHLNAPLLRLPHRAAGSIALASFGMNPIDLNPQQTYLPHVAALANPLPQYEFQQLYNCFKLKRGEQGEFGCE